MSLLPELEPVNLTSIGIELDPSTNSLVASKIGREDGVIVDEIERVDSAGSFPVIECVRNSRSSCRIIQVFLHQASCLSKPRPLWWVLQ